MPAGHLERRGLVLSFLFGGASLLVAELLVAGLLLWPPVNAVAGTPHSALAAPAVAPRAPSTEPPPRDRFPALAPTTAPPPQTSPPTKPAPPRRGQRPGTIRLPAGGTANLVRKEVGANAVLPIPANLGEATWWGAGLDASSGASVVAGHVNWGGRTGPFAELWDDHVHQMVTVTDDAGTAWKYRISQVITLHKDDLAKRADELFSQDGPHRIVLVTCDGRWQGGSTGYAENRVVIAEPAE